MRQTRPVANRFLEHHTVLVLDGRVFELSVMPAVAGAVVLDLDDAAANLAMRENQDISDDRRVLAGRRVQPHELELTRQVHSCQVKALPQVAAPEFDAGLLVPVQASDDIPRCA
ncbi:MAG: hypothetical protein NTU53_18180 [Planctomycetota bacterium]|nr:hypothetical protein [Planctomycetota bacterium]